MDYKEIVRREVALRNAKNLSARELSLRMGKSSNYISKAECFDFKLTLENLFSIFEICGTTAEEFFYEKPERYSSDKAILNYFSRITPAQRDALIALLSTIERR